ncbi:MAG: membrane protein insertase YidC [Pseudomonadota bacterium]|nr:membrane protein insertase YidC [Pseudomonadota bacterium]
MDWFRTLLIVAVAVLGWNIIFQWNQDYGQSNDATASEVNNPQDIQVGHNDALKPQVADSINSSLVPQSEKTEVSAPVVTQNEPKIIQVSTDIYDIEIDLNGGDLVRLALKQYPRSVENPDDPFVMLVNNSNAKYIAESGIIGASSFDLDASAEQGRPVFKAAQDTYTMSDNSLVVPLEYTNDAGVTFEKRYIFNKDTYQIQVEYEITNAGDSNWLGRPYSRLRRTGFADPSTGGGFGLPTFLGVAYWDPEEKFTKIKFSDLEDKGTRSAYLNTTMEGGWIGILQHYFVVAWTPAENESNLYRASYSENAKVPGGQEYIVDAVQSQITVKPGETVTTSQSMYAGPKLQDRLKEAAHGLNLSVDYGPLFFISDLLMAVMKTIHKFIGNWGFSIILLTLFIKALLFPLAAKGYRSMAKMREMQPKMVELKKKYGEDRQKMSQELMKLYQKEGVNPLGGCLPMLLQMPIFLALYWALLESVELRQAPFILWIHDLSIMDPYFILPLLMGASMFFQQRLNPEPPDPMQAKVMKFMPIGMTFLFLFFPSGLVLYWFTNNVLSIAQQAYITKKVQKGA